MLDIDEPLLDIDNFDPRLSLHLDSVVHDACAPSWEWHHHGLSRNQVPGSVLFWLVHEGGAMLEADGQTHRVRRGSFLVMPSDGHRYHGWHLPQRHFDVSWFFLRVVGPDGAPRQCGGIEGIPFHVTLEEMGAVERLMERVLMTRGVLQVSCLLAMLDEVRQQSLRRVESSAEGRLRTLGERMRARPGIFHGVAGLERAFGCSKDHFIRLFRGYHGVTPGEFLIHARVEKAAEVLAASDLSLKQIAAQLGYADGASFSRQFKVRMGCSPLAYRKARECAT